MSRQYRLVTVLGAPGSGKSTLVEALVDDWRREMPDGQVRIVDTNAVFAGTPGAVAPPDGDVEGWLVRFKAHRKKTAHPPPAIIVLDDADKYLSGGPPSGIFRDLFTSYRHWRADVLVNARRPQDVPKVVLASSEDVYVFRVREPYGREYLGKMLGEHVVEQIPTEPFRFIRVNVDTGVVTRGKTNPRRQRVSRHNEA